jgi:ribose 1,5-bisphosphokinase PhnN
LLMFIVIAAAMAVLDQILARRGRFQSSNPLYGLVDRGVT